MNTARDNRPMRIRLAAAFALASAAALFASLASAGNALAVTTTYSCTGSAQTFTVPSGITSLAYTVKGAGGGNGGSGETAFWGTKSGGSGGTGAQYTGTWTVSPGDTVTIKVGCKGNNGLDKRDGDGGGSGGWGFFTGGNGGNAGNRNCGFFGCSKSPTGGAGGGGGASGIQIGSLSVVAGGGGGGGGGAYWSDGGGAYGATQGAALANGSNGPKNGDGNGGSGASGGGGGNAGGGVGGDNGGNGGQNGRSAASSSGAISATLSATGGASGTNNGSVTLTYFSEVSITGLPTGASNATSVSATLATVDASTTFECKLDSGSWAACTSPYAITGLTEGSHTLSVRGKDSAGNTGGVNSKTWTVDTTPPAKPVLTGGADGLTRQTRTSIAWSGDLTNGQTATCSIDGGSFTTCPASPAPRTGLANGSYSFAVRVTDPAGNSSTTTRSWTVNTSAATSVSGDTGAAVLADVEISATSVIQSRNTACAIGASVKCWGSGNSGIIAGVSPGYYVNKAKPAVSDMLGADKLSLGFDSACASVSGSIRCIGNNGKGQLGNGTTADNTASASAVQGLPLPITQLASGDSHTCALENSGTVKCWGYNSSGQLGDGTTTNRTTAVSVPGLSGVTFIGAGGGTTCAVIALGAVKCWGDNSRGGLGNGTTSNSSSPVSVAGLTGATKVFTNYSGTSCALLSSGGVKCWGSNIFGEVGNGTTSPSFPYAVTAPVSVSGITTAVDLNLGRAHACAVLADGTVKCWGNNSSGNLGTGPGNRDSSTPVTAIGITSGAALGHGDGTYTCVVLAAGPGGGKIKCFGNNDYGVLGIGNAIPTASADRSVIESATPPPPAPTIAPPAATTGPSANVTFKGERNATFECALDGGEWTTCTSPRSLTGLSDGWHTLSVRGTSTVGTGDASTVSWIADATPPATPTVSSTAVGTTRQTGSTITWSATTEAGDTVTCSVDGGSFGACGTSPRALTGLSDGNHSFAVRATDSFGNSSTGTASWKVDRSAATTASGDTGAAPANVPITATAIVQARFTACTSGAAPIKCWGGNFQNLFSDGSLTSDHAPTARRPVDAMSGATEIALGYNHACGVFDGSVKCSGMNNYGQLGDGTFTDSKSTAVTVQGLTGGVSKLASGPFHTCAVLSDSAVKCWGSNSDGQLGSGTVNSSWPSGLSTPVSVGGVTGAKDIAMGTLATCAVVTAGAVKCWGNDLGRGLFGSNVGLSLTPTTISGLTGATKIGMSASGFACVLLSGGTVKCWGYNMMGTTGTGSQSGSPPYGLSTPTTVVGVANAVDIGVYREHACAVISDGTVKCWGANTVGQLGSGAAGSAQATPVSVSGLTNGVALSRGGDGEFTCALLRPAEGTSGSRAKCWGSSQFGQLGADLIGTSTSSPDKEVIEVTTTPPPPPAPQIAPPAATTLTSADVTFKGEKGATFECKLDSGSWGACTSPKSLTGLSTGWHNFSVRATNSGGTGEASTVSWIASAGSPPAKPTLTGAPTGTVKATTASISFTSDAGATFLCSLDGGPATACTSPRALSGLTDGSHTLTVQAVKDSLTSEEASATWTVDTTAPAAPTLSGAPTGSTSSRSASISFTGEPGGTFQCSVDNGPYGACTSPRALSNLSDGPHNLRVTQTDSVGNVSPVATASWTVVSPPAPDVTPPPVPTLSGAPTSLTNSKSASIGFTSEAGATFICSVDGGSYSSCSSPRALSNLSDGPHSLAVKARDAAGNVSDPATANWTVDTVAPAKPVLSGAPSGATSKQTASIGVIAEGGATLKCRIDGGAEQTCASPIELKDLADGEHGVLVRAVDDAGNASAAASASWDVDTLAPSVTLTGAPKGTVKTRTASITIDTEQAATVTCSVDGGAFSACSGKVDLADLADGEHSLAVKAVDAAENYALVVTDKWVVDATAPAAPTLFGAPSGTTSQDGATISFTSEPGATFTCSVDGGAYEPCTAPKALSGLAEGDHSLAVKAKDAAGNEGPAATASWTVDTTPPSEPVVTGAPAQATALKTATLRFTSEPGVTFTCSVDGGAFAACSSPRTLTGLTEGSHSFVVLATDAAGNVSEPGSAEWYVAGDYLPPGRTTTAIVTWKAPKPGGTGNTWFINAGASFTTAGDARVGSQILTIQVSTAKTKPLDTQAIPTTATFANGVLAWNSADVERASLDRPLWIRVGNRTGKWTGWFSVALRK